ncbi:hypothetical protein PENSPDRAFT_284054 [Peniophora sp. CONT]|nr:hypothetical protein PENSPDRAFT_284054 [Peniophora sp. CONT]
MYCERARTMLEEQSAARLGARSCNAYLPCSPRPHMSMHETALVGFIRVSLSKTNLLLLSFLAALLSSVAAVLTLANAEVNHKQSLLSLKHRNARVSRSLDIGGVTFVRGMTLIGGSFQSGRSSEILSHMLYYRGTLNVDCMSETNIGSEDQESAKGGISKAQTSNFQYSNSYYRYSSAAWRRDQKVHRPRGAS